MSDHATSNQPFRQRFVLRNRQDDFKHAQAIIMQAAEGHQFDDACRFGIRTALEEAVSNAFKHGNGDDPAKSVQLDCEITDKALKLRIEDEGPGFNPGTVPDPTQQENVEIPAGRGLLLIRAFMTTVTIPPPGNRVEMTLVRAQVGAD